MKWFINPFATSGDKTAVPDDTQVDGTVSYEKGYGIDYEREPGVDPLAKRIERNKMNQLFFDLTSWVRELHIWGTPQFITSAQNGGVPYSYGKYAQVMFDAGAGLARYESLVDSNMTDPNNTTNWRLVDTAQVPNASTLVIGKQRNATQAEANARTLDNVTVTPNLLTPIVSIGVAQTWQNVTGSRLFATNYTNTTGRPILVSVTVNTGSGNDNGTFLVDGVIAGYVGGTTSQIAAPICAVVPAGSVYRLNRSSVNVTVQYWAELR